MTVDLEKVDLVKLRRDINYANCLYLPQSAKEVIGAASQLAEEIERLQGRHRASQESLTELLTEHRKQGEENAKLVEALGFYANKRNYSGTATHSTYIGPKIHDDNGVIARAALPPNPTETATEGGDESG